MVSHSPSPVPPPRVHIEHTGFLSWALLDRATGTISGAANLAAPSDTMSMVKAWIAADYLRMAADEEISAAGPRWTAWVLDEMRQVRGAGEFGVRLPLPERHRTLRGGR